MPLLSLEFPIILLSSTNTSFYHIKQQKRWQVCNLRLNYTASSQQSLTWNNFFLSGFNQFNTNTSTTRVDLFLHHVINSDMTARDRDMELGADVVLHRLLFDLVSDENGQLADGMPSSFTLRQRQKIGIICKSIEMMYQCSKKQVDKSFQRIGMDLLDVFSVVLSTELRIHNGYRARAMNTDAQQLPDLPHS